MISKDLNLSLNHNRIKPISAARRTPDDKNFTATLASLEPDNTEVIPSTPTPHHSSQQASSTNHLFQLITIGAAIVNAVFLVFAGFWLTNSFDSKSKYDSMYAELESHRARITVDLGDQITKLQKQLTNQRNALQQQLQEFQLVFRVDQQEIVSDYLDMTEQFQNVISQTQNTTQTITPQTNAITSLNNWYVNIGTFVNKSAARGLQRQIANLGYPAITSSLALEGKVVQRVQIAGFADRASAEAVAQKLMETTELNGLWAWKSK